MMDESTNTHEGSESTFDRVSINKEKSEVKVPSLIIKALADAIIFTSPLSYLISFGSGKSLEERKVELIKDLSQTGVDPMIFDSLLSNEINRKLKVNFGVAFIVLTFVSPLRHILS